MSDYWLRSERDDPLINDLGRRGVWTRTQKGRVIYGRKRHAFKFADIRRIAVSVTDETSAEDFVEGRSFRDIVNELGAIVVTFSVLWLWLGRLLASLVLSEELAAIVIGTQNAIRRALGSRPPDEELVEDDEEVDEDATDETGS